MTRPPDSVWDRLPAGWARRIERVGDAADARGQAAVLVGGSVRDLLLNRPPKDWDVVVEGAAGPVVRDVAAAEDARVESHPAFLTFAIHFKDGTSLDVATARTETYARPGALPTVRPAALAEDFARRDFTVNAMACRATPADRGRLEDPLGGRADLDRGLVRALHPKSFEDDPTRLYRAARYAARYGWSVEPDTAGWIDRAVREDRPALLSPVRRRNELFHLLEEDRPLAALQLLETWGLGRFAVPSYDLNRVPASVWVGEPSADRLARRLAGLLGPDPAVAEKALRAAQTPVPLRRRVTEWLRDPRFVVDTFGRKN